MVALMAAVGQRSDLVHHLLALQSALALKLLRHHGDGHVAPVRIAVCRNHFKLDRLELCPPDPGDSDLRQHGDSRRGHDAPFVSFFSMPATTVSPPGGAALMSTELVRMPRSCAGLRSCSMGAEQAASAGLRSHETLATAEEEKAAAGRARIKQEAMAGTAATERRRSMSPVVRRCASISLACFVWPSIFSMDGPASDHRA